VKKEAQKVAQEAIFMAHDHMYSKLGMKDGEDIYKLPK
jgi:hypothetical protein